MKRIKQFFSYWYKVIYFTFLYKVYLWSEKKLGFDKKTQEKEMSILEKLFLDEDQEELIRKALKKSAKQLKEKGQSLADIEPEDALLNIINWHLDTRHQLLNEAEKRAKNKVAKIHKEFNEKIKTMEKTVGK